MDESVEEKETEDESVEEVMPDKEIPLANTQSKEKPEPILEPILEPEPEPLPEPEQAFDPEPSSVSEPELDWNRNRLRSHLPYQRDRKSKPVGNRRKGGINDRRLFDNRNLCILLSGKK